MTVRGCLAFCSILAFGPRADPFGAAYEFFLLGEIGGMWGPRTMGRLPVRHARRRHNVTKYSKIKVLAGNPDPVPNPVPQAAPAVPQAAARYVEVDENHEGQRLDNFLIGQCRGVPKSHVYRIVRSGEVRVNRGRAAPDQRLAIGDLVRIPPMRTAPEPDRRHVPGQEFPILFEDEALLAIDKPSGVAVHGGSGVSFGVIEQLRAARPQAKLLELVHRIDRETSGVLLVAKKRAMLTALHELMRGGRIRKRYLALVCGSWQGGATALRFPLHKFLTAEGERRVVVQDGGQEAGTRVRPKAWLEHPIAGALTLLECDLETGRTHQIRVHLAHVGHPLVGDEKYGDFVLNKRLDKLGYKRMYLHAFSISFRHPADDRELRFEAPLPADFERIVSDCSRRAAQPR
jgi:23S rRNA pseudouridine955/2504/2580 synthase